jgi:hypothetical protein
MDHNRLGLAQRRQFHIFQLDAKIFGDVGAADSVFSCVGR